MEGFPKFNFLSLIACQRVRILYVGSEVEQDAEWLYARTETDHCVGAEGWLLIGAVEEERCVEAVGAFDGAEDEGHLRLALGERVRARYRGSVATGDAKL